MTAASSRDVRLGAGRLVGTTVEKVEARGKHLLITFTNAGGTELVLHTHLGMKGSWRVQPAGGRWGRSPGQAGIVIEAGDHHAACFSAPLVRLAPKGALEPVWSDRGLSSLGPDLLDESFTPVGDGPDGTAAGGGRTGMDEILRRVNRSRAAHPGRTIGELLLDQSVSAGIGNVYRCEALFLRGVSPFRPLAEVDDALVADLVGLCASMLRANAAPRARGGDSRVSGVGDGRGGRAFGRDTGGGPGRSWVHRRAGLPCRRCGTPIRSVLYGHGPRTVYWCPSCQPGPAPAGS